MIEQFEARIKELAQQLEQSLVNHNFLAGALNEVKSFKAVYEKVYNIIPLVEAAVPAMEEAVSAVEVIAEAVE